MTKVNFYHLGDWQSELTLLLCTLVSDALKQKRDVLVHTSDRQMADDLCLDLDRQLALGALIHTGEAPCGKVSLCWGNDPGHHFGLLINLRSEISPWFSRFEHLAEFVWGDDQRIAAKRETFRFLRHRGYPLNYCDLTRDGTQGAPGRVKSAYGW